MADFTRISALVTIAVSVSAAWNNSATNDDVIAATSSCVSNNHFIDSYMRNAGYREPKIYTCADPEVFGMCDITFVENNCCQECYKLNPTPKPTTSPTTAPTANPTKSPTSSPITISPTVNPTTSPITQSPTTNPTVSPTLASDIFSGSMRPTRGHVARIIETSNREYVLEFDWTPTGKNPGWSTIMSASPNDYNTWHAFANMPMIYVWPHSTKLHVVLSSSSGKRFECVNSQGEFKLNQKHRVSLTVVDGACMLKLDDKFWGAGIPSSLAPPQKNVKFFTTKNEIPAQGLIGNIDYNKIHRLTSSMPMPDTAVERGNLLGVIKTTPNWELSFNITVPMRNINGWTNILQFTKSTGWGGDKRIPSIYYYPGSHRIHFRYSIDAKKPNLGCDPELILVSGKTYGVLIRRVGTSFVVNYDGKEACSVSNVPVRTGIDATYVWASNPWYNSGGGRLANIIYKTLE